MTHFKMNLNFIELQHEDAIFRLVYQPPEFSDEELLANTEQDFFLVALLLLIGTTTGTIFGVRAKYKTKQNLTSHIF